MSAPHAAADPIAVEQAARFHRIGIVEVFALWLPIFIWMVHLGSMAALVAYVRSNPNKWWVFWIDTGVCAAAIIVCIAVGLAIGIRPMITESDGTPEGRNRFLAWQVLLAGLASLALTLAEGSYVLFIGVHHP
jgi:hypothetical protein